ncbi:hypothetical protein [Carnobacterium maltaromaticum]|uniref:hypothetical protein n=1 Tax=Carnobacterium maltaromaticum TaxID=2751 RepID=UPI00295EFD1C|nr:hypothetical protein [Carnobacterium maltaromaticum]
MEKLIISCIVLSGLFIFSGCASNSTTPNTDVFTTASVLKDAGKWIAKEFKKIETEMTGVSSDILSKKLKKVGLNCQN